MAETISQERLRAVRDMVLRYLYENAAHEFSFQMPEDRIMSALGVSHKELQNVAMILINQRMFGDGVAIGYLGINERGQAEAERLGPNVLLREPPAPSSITVNSTYSIVQMAGSNSSQNASFQIDQSRIGTILDDIERELPSLPMDEPKREQASGIIAALRNGMAAKIGLAGLQAMGGALSSLLASAGSKLGERLGESLSISV